jgi:hypothetical protein
MAAGGGPVTASSLSWVHATLEREEAIAAGIGKHLPQARPKASAWRGWHGAVIGKATGTSPGTRCLKITEDPMIMLLTWAGVVRAGEGNRTLMTSLEGWGSTIELRPRRRTASP